MPTAPAGDLAPHYGILAVHYREGHVWDRALAFFRAQRLGLALYLVELAEQLDWQLPDVIFYPTGGGQPGDTGVLRLTDGFSKAVRARNSFRTPVFSNFFLKRFNALSIDSFSLTLIIIIEFRFSKGMQT